MVSTANTFRLAAVLLLPLSLGCGSSSPSGSSVSPMPASADGGGSVDGGGSAAVGGDAGVTDGGAADGEATSASHKPLMTGLIDKGSEAAYHAGAAYPVTDPASNGDTLAMMSPAFGGLVINQTWQQLEPSNGTFDFSVLDASLVAVATYNAAHVDAPLGARLRVFGAYAAPGWAKTLDGGPIATSDGNAAATVGKWWGPTYRTAWAGLQAALAARYDDNPLLQDVAVSSCAASTAEPMVIDTDTLQAAQPEGWTTDQEHECLLGAFSDYATWKRTPLYFPLNPVAGDATIEPDILQHCASSSAAGGPLCILANNALDDDVTASGSRLVSVYAGIDASWEANPASTPVGFQMNGPTTSTWCGAIAVAVDHHALSVELWPTGFATLQTATLEGWAQNLAAGIDPTCT
jgi:hypothetical protein